MDKDFSREFMHDIADLLECCKENHTENVTFTLDDLELNVNITFSVKQIDN